MIPSRGSEAGLVLLAGISLADAVQLLQFNDGSLAFARTVPHINPVDLLAVVSLDDFDDVLRWVRIRRTRGSISCKVVQHFLRFVSSCPWLDQVRTQKVGCLLSPKYAIFPPLASRRRESKASNSTAEGWWMVHCKS